MKFLSLDQNTVKSPNGNLTILHPFSVTFIGYLWISGCNSNLFNKSTKLYMDHLICPANSPLDLTRVSDQTIGCFSMFLNLPFNWNIMVIHLFLSLDLHCGMPFPSFKSNLKTHLFNKAFAWFLNKNSCMGCNPIIPIIFMNITWVFLVD